MKKHKVLNRISTGTATKMRAKVITLSDNPESFQQADVLIDSSNHFDNEFTVDKFIATTVDNVVEEFKTRKLQWNYPWTKGHIDIATGLWKSPYETADPKKRMACFMSHYRLWELCVQHDEPYMILEHDALFTRKLELKPIQDSKYSVISLNDPRGATRRSQAYHEAISQNVISPVPWIDNHDVPQGLPGNSAYFIKPKGAIKLIKLVKEFGAWPNDAIMCKQLMTGMLGCLGRYATTVQATHQSSTTT